MDLQSLVDIAGQKYFGIPLILLLIGFGHLGFMATVLFGQAALEMITKNLGKKA